MGEPEGSNNPVTVWLSQYDRETTRITYAHRLKEVLHAIRMNDPELFLEQARRNPVDAWHKVRGGTLGMRPMSRYFGLSVVRSFLLANNVYPPPDRLRRPGRISPPATISWEEALRIINGAEMPWRFMFKLMLHVGWGAREFLVFNTEQRWNDIQTTITQAPNAEYYRCNFPWRKSNGQPFYSLIPTGLLREILKASIPLPIRTPRGARLDVSNYWNARLYMTAAFKKAVKKSGLTLQGRLTMHELRDVFGTRATLQDVAFSAKQFALGHTVDPAGYDKSWSNEPWIWKELSKIYQTPTQKQQNTPLSDA